MFFRTLLNMNYERYFYVTSVVNHKTLLSYKDWSNAKMRNVNMSKGDPTNKKQNDWIALVIRGQTSLSFQDFLQATHETTEN
jgi:hypothetical protein